MSGFCAVVNLDGRPVDPGVLEAMLAAGAHRGPDGCSWKVDGEVAFGHLALHATPEAEREQQPLVDPARRLWLAADALIANREELLAALRADLPDGNDTDAALILAAYARWGVECAGRLDGDFAFVIWDEAARRLFCATDPFATRPLHFARRGNTVCIASEGQQILRHPLFPPKLDPVAVGDYLVNLCADAERTIFQGVRRLAPAHVLVSSAAGDRTERYWDIDPERKIRYRTTEDYVAAFRERLERAVRVRLRAAGPVVGIFVSGGLDSGSVAVVAHAQLEKEGRGRRLSGYSYAFPNLTACDEFAYSSRLTEERGIGIRYVNAEAFPVLDAADAGRPTLETPFAYTDTLALHILGAMREEGARVALTGHGGDSLLQGSGLIYLDRLLRGDLRVFPDLVTHSRRNGSPMRDLVYQYLVRPLLPEPVLSGLRRLAGRAPEVPAWVEPTFAREVGLVERLRQRPAPLRFRSRARQEQYEMIVSPRSVGRASYVYDRLAHRRGMEARHPMLDRQLAEFILSIPDEQVYQPGTAKYLLRRALDGFLPDRICRRRDKTHFEPHFRYSFLEVNRELVECLLEDPLVAQMGFCSAAELRRTYERYRAGTCSATEGMLLLLPVSLERWLRQFREVL